mmetsp:Transcript_127128/g.220348  ORF Transcript_127128/g.220348 Transcript_127128/m.220348 type:complete len:361 (-) Transcript_127128:67-1149(-)
MAVTASTVAKCCTGVASLGCLVGAIVLLELSTEEYHEKRARDFASAVESWPSARYKFSGVTPQMSIGDGKAVSLAGISPPDYSKLINAEDLPEYEAFCYQHIGTPEGVLPALTALEDVEWDMVPVPGSKEPEGWGFTVQLALELGGSKLATQAIPLVRAKPHLEQQGLYNHCRERHGNFHDGKCWLYERLQRVCMQVAKDGYGEQWHFAHRVAGLNTSYGCDYSKGNWSAPVYKKVPIAATPGGKSHETRTTLNFDDLEIEVRSVHDPYLKAVELTEGTLDFGLSASDEQWMAMVLVMMCILLACPPVCSICLWWHKQRLAQRPFRPSRSRMQKESEPVAETVGMKYAVGYDDEQGDYRG